jgi:hypothetical protein
MLRSCSSASASAAARRHPLRRALAHDPRLRRPTRNEERAIAAGLAALLGLVLTRVTVGARVAFFDPFLERGIETAVGLCCGDCGRRRRPAHLEDMAAAVPRRRAQCAGQSSPLSVARVDGVVGPALIPQVRAAAGGQGGAADRDRTALLTYTTGAARGTVCSPASSWSSSGSASHGWQRSRATTSTRTSAARTRSSNSSRRATCARATTTARDSRLRRFARTPEIAIIGAALVLVLAHMLPVALLARWPSIAGALVTIVCAAAIGHSASNRTAGSRCRGRGCRDVRRDHRRAPPRQRERLDRRVRARGVRRARVRAHRPRGRRAHRSARTRGRAVRVAARLACCSPRRCCCCVPFAAIDMGLVLVLVIPLASATLLATGIQGAGRRLVVPAACCARTRSSGKKVCSRRRTISATRTATRHRRRRSRTCPAAVVRCRSWPRRWTARPHAPSRRAIRNWPSGCSSRRARVRRVTC